MLRLLTRRSNRVPEREVVVPCAKHGCPQHTYVHRRNAHVIKNRHGQALAVRGTLCNHISTYPLSGFPAEDVAWLEANLRQKDY